MSFLEVIGVVNVAFGFWLIGRQSDKAMDFVRLGVVSWGAGFIGRGQSSADWMTWLVAFFVITAVQFIAYRRLDAIGEHDVV